MTDPDRDFSDEPTLDEPGDPCRVLLMAAVQIGLLTQSDADALDVWAGGLATEMAAGKLTEDEMQRRIATRLEADIARRGSA